MCPSMTISHFENETLALLDRALADQRRAARYAEGSDVEPLMQPQMRWDLVMEARNRLASQR